MLLQGDIVGVAVDVQLGCLSFYINNVPVVRDADAEAAAKKGKGKFASSYAIASPGATRFRPAVYMYALLPLTCQPFVCFILMWSARTPYARNALPSMKFCNVLLRYSPRASKLAQVLRPALHCVPLLVDFVFETRLWYRLRLISRC